MTEAPTDFTKPIQTRSGLKAVLLQTDPVKAAVLRDDGEWEIYFFRDDGKIHGNSEISMDLVNVPEPIVLWSNHYPNGYSGGSYILREEADLAASTNRIAVSRTTTTGNRVEVETFHDM